MHEQKIEIPAQADALPPSGRKPRWSVALLLSVALLTAVLLLIPSIRGFSLSAEQEAQVPGQAQREAREIASREVVGYVQDSDTLEQP